MRILFTLTFIFSLISTQSFATQCALNCELNKDHSQVQANSDSHGCCHGNKEDNKNQKKNHLCGSELNGICSHQQYLMGASEYSSFANDDLAPGYTLAYITLLAQLNQASVTKDSHPFYLREFSPFTRPVYLKKNQFLI